ncbi:hypothetical protein KPL71_026451 [Citrus sinensis]|uniref:Uncharacterized protein n=1 Tax=Citrus sinensis TaxID=2711 RepID=A0ACB8I045_CITSI|nr:hypothetical protein KPL71_026451 [Citrus sinensis]
MSPYNLYKQKTSFTRSICTLISTKRPLPKEYIQSSRLDQCALQASQSEQYVTLEIPPDLVANWKREGYTHLHLGGVRLILTFHGRKGLPVTARIALPDTKFKQYQYAVIGTVLTTLHAGSVLLTFYPNFNLSLEDPNLPTTIKVQIKLQGAEQTPTSKIATLHHQIVYRLQNHALDLPTPHTTSDALMILADTDTIPTIIQIPKQIQKQELLTHMPLEWLTNYEQFHQNFEPSKLVRKRTFQSIVFHLKGIQYTLTKSMVIFYGMFLKPNVPQPPVYNQFFGFSHLQPTPPPKPSSPKKSKSKVKLSEPTSKATSSVPPILPEDSPKATLEPPKKDKGPMDQYHYHTIQNTSSDSSELETVYESNPSESNPSSSSSSTNSGDTSTDSESEYADITSILMATKTEDPSASTATPIIEESSSDAENQAAPTEPEPSMPPPIPIHSTKPSSVSWFTFDDIPHHKWPTRLQEFAAWIDLQGTKPNAHPESVLREFMARSTGSLRDWLESLGEYRQIQFMQSPIGTALNIIHEQFIDVESNFLEQSEQNDQTAFILAESSDSDDILSHFHSSKCQPDTSMIDPSVLSSDCWENHSILFRAVNGETFETTLITKRTHCYISQKLLEFCPENHSQFHHPSPLGKNEQFFIHLPFKLNEDINPTKPPHPGMSPSDLSLAKQECSQLLQQGLIEPTDSDWACQAFYVEKRSELVRGKKRLVIDYQPLNSFLKDDKFPLLKVQTLFVHLQGACIFSKFDLKAGFWQLGISPVDHPKTAFCIPDAHYQWTVMPFGLKVAPSLFQKAMTKIFSPILHHVLVYIDDILLFSSDHDSHQNLLLDFFHIVQDHGIMLSEKKSSIAKESIDFLGMVITNGRYLPAQTEAVKQLKVIAQSPLPLRIPTTGQRILQTDASDDYWSAILLERIDGLTLSHLSISEDELWYMWCLTTLYATKLVFPVKPVLRHITTPEFSSDLLWTLLEWYSPLTWWRKQLQNLCTFHSLNRITEHEANMFTTVFIVHRPYFQHPETRDFWTQDMAYECKTYPHHYPLIHDTSITSVLRAYLMELNNVQPPATNIHHTSVGPSHNLEIVPKTQTCTPGSSSSPHGILVMEQRPDYTNVLF